MSKKMTREEVVDAIINGYISKNPTESKTLRSYMNEKISNKSIDELKKIWNHIFPDKAFPDIKNDVPDYSFAPSFRNMPKVDEFFELRGGQKSDDIITYIEDPVTTNLLEIISKIAELKISANDLFAICQKCVDVCDNFDDTFVGAVKILTPLLDAFSNFCESFSEIDRVEWGCAMKIMDDKDYSDVVKDVARVNYFLGLFLSLSSIDDAIDLLVSHEKKELFHNVNGSINEMINKNWFGFGKGGKYL